LADILSRVPEIAGKLLGCKNKDWNQVLKWEEVTLVERKDRKIALYVTDER